MSDMSRRLFLKGSPVSALAAVSALQSAPIMIMAGADPVYAAIAAHKDALRDFAAECDWRETLTEPSAEDDARYDRLCQAEIDALMAVADTQPQTEIGANAALAHLIREGDQNRYGALLESFAQGLIAAKWSD